MAGLSGEVQQLDKSYKRAMKLNDSNSNSDVKGKRLQLVSYTSQVVIIFTVILACIINLSRGSQQSELWSSLLSLALGCMLPNPKLRQHNVKQKQLLPSPPFQFQSQLLPGQYHDSLHNSPSEDDGAGGFLGMRTGGDTLH